MPDRPDRQPERPGLLSRLAARVVTALEAKAAPALAYRHGGRGGSGYSSGSWWGDGRSGLVFGGAMPGDDRDIAADAGDVWLNSAVAACISWLTDQFNEPEFRVTSLNRKTGDYEPYDTHPLIDLLETPNDGYDTDSLWAATVLSWQVNDKGAFWVKSRAKSGKVRGVWFVPACEIEPVWPEDGSEFVAGYRQTVDGVTYDLPREDVVHFRRGLNPYDLRCGIAPLGTVLREVATDNAAAFYEKNILINMGIVPTLIQPAEAGDQFGPGEDEIIKEQFQAKTTGSNRGRAVVLNARVDIKQFGLGPKDMSLGSIRYIPEDRICAATGVNAMVVGLSSGSMHKTYNNLSEATRSAYNRALIPMQRSFARALTRQLLVPDFGGRAGLDYCDWCYDEVAALSEDATARITRAVMAWDARLIKRGEACEIAGCNPPAEADDVYKPSEAVAQAVANADARDDGRINNSVVGDGSPQRGRGRDDDEAGDGDGDDADDGSSTATPAAPPLRIAKALAAVDAGRDVGVVVGHAASDGHAADDSPFARLAARVAAPGVEAADDADAPGDPWTAEDVAAALAMVSEALDAIGEPSFRLEDANAQDRRDALHALIETARAALAADAVATFGTDMTPAPGASPPKTAKDGEVEIKAGTPPPADVIASWKSRTAAFLRRAYLAGSILLNGGSRLSEPSRAALHAANAAQLGYLDGFAAAVRSGDQPLDGTLAARAALYGSAAWSVAQAVEREAMRFAGKSEERAIHGGSDAPCAGCVDRLDRGWWPIGMLVPIGEADCLSACHCYLEYR